MTDIIYDLETYPNIWSFCSLNTETHELKVFEISDRKDERKALLSFLRRVYKNKDRLVGFNNIYFDYPILHYLLKNQNASVYSLYKKAMSIIESDEDDKFANLVKPNDVLIPQIDLYKIHHFDNKAKSCSLKMIQFNSRSDTIEDLPFPVGVDLNNAQKDTLIEYNKHDVLKTLDFYKETLPKIQFRENLSKLYGRDFMNHNDTKIGKDYFIMRLEEVNPQACYERVGKRRVMKQTKRKSIALKDCIFPYVKFQRPEFNAVLEWFKRQTITETKGVFTDILESDLGDVAQYAEMVVKRKKLLKEPSDAYVAKLKQDKPAGYIVKEQLASGKDSWYFCWKVADTLNVVVDGFRYDFGVGGIHGSVNCKIVVSTDSVQLIDADVSSYYPNMAISNNVYPEHLGLGFCKIYKDVYEQRKTYKKGTDENATMKLALNGVYGDSNNEYSPFYDPMYTMKITINGQLSLCMLAEQLMRIEGLEVIQCNTDGITVSCPKDQIENYHKVCNWWQKVTQLELEFNNYSKMCIRDCNNYIAVYENGNVKRKGAYEYQDLGHHQDQSALVIPKAVEASLVSGVSIDQYIKSHTDKYDFMLRVKVPRSNRLISVDEFGIESEEQKICRYYVSNSGVTLLKIMPALEGGKTIKVWYNNKKDESIETDSPSKEVPLQKRIEKGEIVFVKEYFKKNEERTQEIEAGWKVQLCNNIKYYNGDINYEYYIHEANKLVEIFK
jgi:hypothetical protein